MREKNGDRVFLLSRDNVQVGPPACWLIMLILNRNNSAGKQREDRRRWGVGLALGVL